ncbi:MAG: efflux RND transporter permease subunit, partial [Pseudomonadota bacterium]
AALMGVAQRDVVAAVRIGLAGEDVTPLHESGAKYEVPVRVSLPPAQANRIESLLRLKVRAAGGALIPLTELVRAESVGRDATVYHKDLLPVVYVVGDMAGKLDSPLYGMFDIRGR